MNTAIWFSILEPWPSILLQDFLRYLIPTSLCFVVFSVLLAARLMRRRIQDVRPQAKQMRREIVYSLSTTVIFSSTGLYLYHATLAGFTHVYLELPRFGWAYAVLSLVMTLVLHDTYFYWTHRLMHHPRVFPRVHRVHHLSHSPSPWAAYAFHPMEALVHSLFLPMVTQFLPLHPLVIFLFVTFMILRNVFGHLGLELFPAGFVMSPWTRWNTTTTHHDLHHQGSHANYGLYFTWWDAWMRTEAIDYRDNFLRITQRAAFPDSASKSVTELSKKELLSMHSTRHSRVSLLILILGIGLVATPPVSASSTRAEVAETDTERIRFERGSTVSIAYLASIGGQDDRKGIDVVDAHVGLGYYVVDGVGLYGELYGTHFRGSLEDGVDQGTAGGGGALLLRWHFLRRRHCSVFGDAGLGVLLTRRAFPVGGTHTNFTPQFGLGATVRVHDKVHLVGGVRRLHISNGKGLLPENPSYDGIGAYLGFAFAVK